MKFKINNKTKSKYLYRKLFEITVISIIVMVLVNFLYKNPSDIISILNIFIVVLIMLFLIYVLPLLILYSNHIKHSKNVEFVYNDIKKRFYYKNNISETTFSLNDIEKINFYLTPAGYKETFDLSYFRDYRYYEIILHNENKIFISCLTCDTLESFMPNNLITRKKKFLPLINA